MQEASERMVEDLQPSKIRRRHAPNILGDRRSKSRYQTHGQRDDESVRLFRLRSGLQARVIRKR